MTNLVTLAESWDLLMQESTKLEAENAALRVALENREARRREILDWLQDKIGTAHMCECGAETYHNFSKECQECGAEFPLLDMLAFKMHAPGTDNEEYLSQATDAGKRDNAKAQP